METPISEQDIEYAETYLAAGDISTASQMLERYLELAEEYIAEECQATDEVQYFSFQDSFERLCYARVEHDPRRIVAVPAPFDRLYSDVAYVCIQQQDYERARDALVQAVRWNPMNCKYRLDLAEIFRALGDIQEWAALSNSVLERASDGRVAARAYSNLGQLFIDQDNAVAASGCARLAVRLAPADARTVALMDRLAKEHPEVAKDSDDHVMGELSIQGIPTSPSADVAICLLICASDAAMAGDRARAAEYTARANGLIGKEACSALIKMIREADNEGGANAQ
ncbi:hypothetical protein ACTQX1_02715 [Collinsella bouchesdurhonensis]|uniref:hypothetical protein n=1 Tax=Collinsella bouchesdurhonensis TaxID=1907654 RepID=UPI00096A8907|nr:hypothetical protein [Collinsella bouchesdurhonensis]MCI5785608.1 hypothetical protein [Collinsella bouchesdurhonensis]MDY3054118.1 hypothetical protein [Collinsella bouchesdurhonensis]